MKIRKPFKDTSLIEKRCIGKGYTLRIENDDWGKFIRIVDMEGDTVFGKLVVNEDELELQIQQAIALYK
jgi:hypothetical protein